MKKLSNILVLIGASFVLLNGCGGDGNKSGTDAGHDGGSIIITDAGHNSGNTDVDAGDAGPVDSGTDTGVDAGPSCTGTPAHGGTCYSCAPVTLADYLNRCYSNTVDCEPFDNTRIPAP